MIIDFSAGSGTLVKDGNDIIPYTSDAANPIFYDLWSSDNGTTVHVKQFANVTTSTGEVTAGVTKVTQAVTNNTSTNYATTEFVHNILPKGVILMWSGSVATVPTGWALCDGTTVSGVVTPDLTNRFVVGAGDDYAVAATGGSTDAIVVSHNHNITDNGHTHFIANTDNAGGSTTTYISNTLILERQNGAEYHLQGSSTAATVGLTSNNPTSISVNSQGSSGSGANMPPYYALAYIIKVTGD
jgi:microcystin-dependent protein